MIDAKFLYDGVWRRVSNITFEPDYEALIGFEMRRNGKFSYQTKRYTWSKVHKFELIPSMVRSGPKVGI